MIKSVIFSIAFGVASFSVMAADVSCPKPDSVTSTKIEKDADGISSMIYCSPTSSECNWKGFDPFATEGHKVSQLLNSNGNATEHNGLVYCDYKLDTGDQVRLSLLKKP